MRGAPVALVLQLAEPGAELRGPVGRDGVDARGEVGEPVVAVEVGRDLVRPVVVRGVGVREVVGRAGRAAAGAAALMKGALHGGGAGFGVAGLGDGRPGQRGGDDEDESAVQLHGSGGSRRGATLETVGRVI